MEAGSKTPSWLELDRKPSSRNVNIAAITIVGGEFVKKDTLLKSPPSLKKEKKSKRFLQWLGAEFRASVSLGVLASGEEDSPEDAAKLLVEVNKVLDAGTFGARFNKIIEQRFDQASKQAYAALFMRLAIVGTVFYNLFLFVDPILVPDVIRLAIILQLGVATPIAIISMVAIQKWDVDVNRAAFITLSGMSGCTIAIFMASRSEHIALFPAVFMLFIFAASVAQALPFSWAFVFAGLLGGAATIALLIHPSLDAPAKIFSVVVVASSTYYALVGSFRINAGVRRTYLFALRESLRAQLLVQSNIQLQSMIDIDGLTGIGNRRHFETSFDRIWHEKQDDGSVALLMIDVDRFKRLNDTYGHQVGDTCLRVVAQTLADGLAGIGVISRYGGEEFAAILPEFDLREAVGVADRLRRSVEALTIQLDDASTVKTTVSVGAAACSPTIVAKSSDLVAAADAALYLAKQAGRNRTEGASLGQMARRVA